MNAVVRAFLSIDIEEKTLLSRINQIQQKLSPQGAKMKLVEPDNIHFTMRFFGDTPLARINQIQDCLKQIEITPFEINIVGVGAFPNKRKPRVIWIGVTDNSQLIVDLKLRVDNLLNAIGYQAEREKFTPHATIARVRTIKDSSQIVRNLEELVDESVGIMTVKSISMKKSTLTSSGPIYETLWRI